MEKKVTWKLSSLNGKQRTFGKIDTGDIIHGQNLIKVLTKMQTILKLTTSLNSFITPLRRPGKGWGTPLYQLYRNVRPQRV